MSNMSYCRFRNTVGDMRDCIDALEEMQNAKFYEGQLVVILKNLEQAEREADLVGDDDQFAVQRIQDRIDNLEKEVDYARRRLWRKTKDQMATALSEDEYNRAREFLRMCKEISENYTDEVLVKEQR